MRPRLLGLVLSGLVHAAIIGAVVLFVRTAAPPVLFVDLAHGLDVAEHAVEDLRHAMADAGSRVAHPAAGDSRVKLARAPVASPPREIAAPPRPPAPAPAAPAEPVPAVPQQPVRVVPEQPTPAPSPAPVPSAPARVVQTPPPTPSATAATSDSDASAAVAERTPPRSGAAGDAPGRATSGGGASGASASLSDAGGGSASAGGRSGVRDGGPLALAISGARSGDPAAADYAGYYDALRRRLHESLAYPQIARRRGLSGTVLVDVEIDTTGKLGRVTMVSSSSHAVLDEAALDAVRSVSRVPFPPGVTPRPLRVRLPVVFEMR